MPAITCRTDQASRNGKTPLPSPRRFLRCVTCGTIKKERTYALCSECYKLNGRLARGRFTYLARRAERETRQYTYRRHPEFDKACRIYARRRLRTREAQATDSVIRQYRPTGRDGRDRYRYEAYDGLGAHDLGDVLDWQMHGIELPPVERSAHREMADAEVARWDVRVDRWAKARGFTLADGLAPEIQPYGYWMEIDGALVWTDDVD